jgi:hypothetical protein
MATSMTATIKIQVSGGITSSVSHTVTPLDAFDRITVTVPAGAAGNPASLPVEVQPGGDDQVQFLLVTASVYDPKLTYSVDGGAADVVLDAPHLLLGTGAVGLLDSAPGKLTFKNELEEDVAVEILVGRKATT